MDGFRSIVAATDFSPLAEAAVARAAALARLDGAALHLVHALGPPIVASAYEVSLPPALWEELRQSAAARIEEASKRLEESGIERVTSEVADASSPVQAIADAVRTRDADLVVMGTHGYGGLRRVMLGSVAARALHEVDRPVLAVKEEGGRAAEPIRRVLLAVDFSPDSDRAVALGGALASRLGASVDVLHALDLPRDYAPYASELATAYEREVESAVAERLDGMRERLRRAGVPVTLHARRGRPASVIAASARELGSDLIAMGRRGRGAVAEVLLGSVAERTLRAAPCSVLVVKAPPDPGGDAPAWS